MRTQFLFGLAIAVLFGCGAGSSDGAAGEDSDLTGQAPSADEAKACQDGTVGTDATGASVVHCHKPFATAPLVRLPADAITGTQATFYGGMSVPATFDDIAVIWTRDGKLFVAVDAKGKPIAYGANGAKLPQALHAPTNRVTFTLYQFAGKLGPQVDTSYGKATAITLTNVRAVVEIDGCALDSRLLGTFTGSVSARLATPTGSGPFVKAFDATTRIPIHVTLDSITKGATLGEYKGGGRISDGDTYVLAGTLDNFDKDVTIGGKTYASLTAMGATNPFLGAKDNKIQLFRTGNMHGLVNDSHWVLTYPSGSQSLSTTGMSNTLTALTAPAWLMSATGQPADLATVTINPHIPYAANGNSVTLSPEDVGARLGQCQ
jgi:hypothetical protein